MIEQMGYTGCIWSAGQSGVPCGTPREIRFSIATEKLLEPGYVCEQGDDSFACDLQLARRNKRQLPLRWIGKLWLCDDHIALWNSICIVGSF